MKKSLLLLLFLGWLAPSFAQSKFRLIDSLKSGYAVEKELGKRVGILLNLKDLTEASPEEMHYSRLLFGEACVAGDGFAAGASLGSLAAHYISAPNGGDSLELLLRKAEPILRGSSMEGLVPYYRMVALARRIQVAPTEESVGLCHRYIDSIAVSPPENIYEQASQLFLRGITAYRLSSVEGKLQMERGLPYWNDELELLSRMKPTARRNFHANLITCLISAYDRLQDQNGLMRVADGYLAMLDEYFSNPEILRRRPYIGKEMSYLVCYYTMCLSPRLDRAKSRIYYEQYHRFVESAVADPGNILINKRGFYSISTEYFFRFGDYTRAMAYNDSLIMLTRPSGMSSLLVGMYDRRARLLQHMGRYKDACGVYDGMIALRDSLSSYEYNEKVGELEVQYGLDKAERDKALLLAEKRQNTLYFGAIILLLAVAAIVYLWRNLLHIKRLQHDLFIESRRAQESDRLKQDFMGSMSHEIRTPLNAINGFAELISAGDLPQEEACEFARIIRDNTRLFTSLINDMLEVSQLDNTSTELPKTPLDICRIIRSEIEHLPHKDGLEYKFNPAAPEVVIPVHRGYISMLVRELLKNAVKFTESGTVTVDCGKVDGNSLSFSVSDTGRGILSGEADKIFDRFYKVDPFAQGLGLGLSLCRLIVEKSGGSIRLDTSYTQGARFVVTLQVAQ